MSTGLECQLIEEAEGVWWYLLQDGNCPVSCWDWREYATLYGPHTSYDEACEHLRENHANPGGHSITSFKDVHPFTPDATFEKLKVEAAEAAKREAARPIYRPFRW